MQPPWCQLPSESSSLPFHKVSPSCLSGRNLTEAFLALLLTELCEYLSFRCLLFACGQAKPPGIFSNIAMPPKFAARSRSIKFKNSTKFTESWLGASISAHRLGHI